MRNLTKTEIACVSGAIKANLNTIGNNVFVDIVKTNDPLGTFYFNGLLFKEDGCYKPAGLFKNEAPIKQGEVYNGHRIVFVATEGKTTYKLSPAS